MKVTIDVIAEKCGVSKVTVSRVIANNPNVNPKTREMVIEAMSQLNYRPKKIAELMGMRQNNIIAILVEDLTRRSSIDVIRSVKGYLGDKGYLTIALEYSSDTFEQALGILQGFCTGCIVIAGEKQPENLFTAPVLSMPVTLIHWNLGWSQIDSVIENIYQCSIMMVEYLAGLGHKRIALVNSPANASGHYDTEVGYMASMRQCGLEVQPQYILESDLTQPGGAAAGKQLLSAQQRPTAAICTNTAVARGVAQVFLQAGIQIPQAFSIMACGLSQADTTENGLSISAVGAKYREMGITAADNLLWRIQEKSQETDTAMKGTIRKLILDPVLYEGSTTAPALDAEG